MKWGPSVAIRFGDSDQPFAGGFSLRFSCSPRCGCYFLDFSVQRIIGAIQRSERHKPLVIQSFCPDGLSLLSRVEAPMQLRYMGFDQMDRERQKA